VPVPVIKRDELGAAQSGYGFGAADALLSKQISEALCAVRFLILRRELLPGQHLVTLGADEALAVPGGVLVRYASLINHSIALETPLGILFLIAWYTDYFLVTWYKTLASYWLHADLATEALLMPLLPLVLKLFHSSFEKSTTPIAPCREIVVMTISTIKPVVLVGERMIN